MFRALLNIHYNLKSGSDRLRRVPQGEEPVPGGVGQGHEDRPHGARAAEQAAEGARGVRLRHRRLRAPQHGLHGAPRHMGRRHALPHLYGLHQCR